MLPGVDAALARLDEVVDAVLVKLGKVVDACDKEEVEVLGDEL